MSAKYTISKLKTLSNLVELILKYQLSTQRNLMTKSRGLKGLNKIVGKLRLMSPILRKFKAQLI
jgi:hypothetical protein